MGKIEKISGKLLFDELENYYTGKPYSIDIVSETIEKAMSENCLNGNGYLNLIHFKRYKKDIINRYKTEEELEKENTKEISDAFYQAESAFRELYHKGYNVDKLYQLLEECKKSK